MPTAYHPPRAGVRAEVPAIQVHAAQGRPQKNHAFPAPSKGRRDSRELSARGRRHAE